MGVAAPRLERIPYRLDCCVFRRVAFYVTPWLYRLLVSSCLVSYCELQFMSYGIECAVSRASSDELEKGEH